MFVWITGQDIGKQTIHIQLDDNNAYDVPKSQIELLTAKINGGIKNYSFRNTL